MPALPGRPTRLIMDGRDGAGVIRGRACSAASNGAPANVGTSAPRWAARRHVQFATVTLARPISKLKERPTSAMIAMTGTVTGNLLIAFAMNGEPLPRHNGAPLRLVVRGWPGACSQKWLRRIETRDQVHDGPKMTGTSYWVPRYPVTPGDTVPDEDFDIIERMPLKSPVTSPEHGTIAAREVEVRGHAWSGDRAVFAVDISIDFGRNWMTAEPDGPVNPGARQNWRCRIAFPEAGYYEVWSRETDRAGDR